MKRPAITLIKLLVFIAICCVLAAPFARIIQNAKQPSRRTLCLNNLHNITLALKHYENDHHAFPPAYTTDANGKPLHSWRTLILPYMDAQGLFDSIDLTK